jgi:hypothetical protein
MSTSSAERKFILFVFAGLAGICGLTPTAIPKTQQSSQSGGKIVVQKRVGELLFDPEHPTPVSYRDDLLSMQLDMSGPQLRVILKKNGQSAQRISLPPEMAQVNEIRRDTARLATVIGMINSDAYEVVVLDITLARIGDTFWAYAPVLSPSGRYIAFIKFFPTHFVEGVDDRYMFYDLTRSAAQNRPAKIDASDRVDVGVTVYPPGKSNREGDNTGVDDSEVHAIASDTFFWSPNADQYFFADRYQGTLSAVRISFDANGRSAATSVDIPQADLCAPVHKQICNVSLTAVDFESQPPGSVTVRFRGVMGDTLQKDFQFRNQQFKPVS